MRNTHKRNAFDLLKVYKFGFFGEFLDIMMITNILLCSSVLRFHSSVPMLGPNPPMGIQSLFLNLSSLSFPAYFNFNLAIIYIFFFF